MKKLAMISIITGLLLLSIIAGTYAYEKPNIDGNWDYMEQMHEQMTKNIYDSKTREAMDVMHESCERLYRSDN